MNGGVGSDIMIICIISNGQSLPRNYPNMTCLVPYFSFALPYSIHSGLISENVQLSFVDYKNNSADVRSQLPVKDDMDGAVLALLRLQDTYNLNTSQFSDSNLGLESPDDEAPPLSGNN